MVSPLTVLFAHNLYFVYKAGGKEETITLENCNFFVNLSNLVGLFQILKEELGMCLWDVQAVQNARFKVNDQTEIILFLSRQDFSK